MAARTASLTNSATIIWSDGTPFNGYLFMVLGYPTSSTVEWPSVSIGGKFPNETLPRKTVFPIKDGSFLTGSTQKLFYTEDIVPPGARYYMFWYDANLKLVSSTTATAVALSADPTTVESLWGTSPVSITVPTASAASLSTLSPGASFAEEHL